MCVCVWGGGLCRFLFIYEKFVFRGVLSAFGKEEEMCVCVF